MIRVLLVDDHPVVRSGYLRLLSQDPEIQVVAEASTADEGYQAFGAHSPDVTITDLSMPGVDGLQMLQELESRPHLADMKIVVVSGVPSEVIAARGGLSPRIDFLRKPVDFSWLRRCVTALVQSPQAEKR